MPCRDYEEDCELFAARQTQQVQKLSRLLAFACRHLDNQLAARHLTSLPIEVRDCAMYTDLVTWWAEMKKIDAIEQARLRAIEEHNAIRATGLAKLTEQEKQALGIQG